MITVPVGLAHFLSLAAVAIAVGVQPCRIEGSAMDLSEKELIESVFSGGGDMGARMRAFDWSATDWAR